MSLRLKLKCRRVMPRVFFAGGRLGGDPAPDENEGPIRPIRPITIHSLFSLDYILRNTDEKMKDVHLRPYGAG